MKSVAKKEDDCPPNSTGEPSPKGRSKFEWSSTHKLTEFRIEEHHEERVGTNIL